MMSARPIPPGACVATADGGPAPSIPRDLLVGDLLARAAAERPDVGITFPAGRAERHFSYAVLLDRARRMAQALAERGVGPGTRIGLLLPTSPEFVTSFFAVLMTGAAAVVLPLPLPFGRMNAAVLHLRLLAERADLYAAICDPGLRALAAQAGIARIVVAGELGGAELHRCAPSLDPDAPALLQFTSGSTLAPRGAVLSHRALLSQIAGMIAASEAGDGDTGCSWLPLYHDMGLIGGLLMPVYAAGPLVLLAPEQFLANPLGWLTLIDRHRVTISPAPNFAYALVARRLARQRRPELNLSRWRIAYNGGEPVDAATLDAVADALAPYGFSRTALSPCYGLAEASLAVTLPRPGRGPRILAADRAALSERNVARPAREGAAGMRPVVSVGPPIPGVTVAIRAEHGTGEGAAVGQIHVAGPTLMSGYFAAPEETAVVLTDGWLATGDLGFLHDGELYVTGRQKDLIIHCGRNVYPQDIESVVNALDGIRPGTAVAVASNPGEQLVVFAEAGRLKPDALAAVAAAIEAEVAAQLCVRPAMVAVLPRATLPWTTSGKIQRQRTLELYAAGLLPVLHERGAITARAEVD